MLVGAILVLSQAVAWPAEAEEVRLGAAELASRLSEIETRLTQSGIDDETMAAIADDLPDSWLVPIGDGTIRVEGLERWLRPIEGEKGEPPGAYRDRVINRIRTMRAALEEASPEANSEPSVRDTAGEILGRPEFQSSRSGGVLDDLLDRLSRWIERWGVRFEDFPGGPERALLFAWAILILGILAVTTLGIRWARRRWRRSPEWALSPEAPVSAGPPWLPWLEGARRAAAAGVYREAVRCQYWAGLLEVASDAGVALDVAKTPRECSRLLSSRIGGSDLLDPVTGRFERIWYGSGTATRDDQRFIEQRFEEIRCRPV